MKGPGTDGAEAMNEGNGTSTFDELADFIDNRMRMQHVYQPVMLMALLRHGGSCPEVRVMMPIVIGSLLGKTGTVIQELFN